MKRRLYLAGPDVFRPDAAEHGRRLVATCAEFGFDAVFPLDKQLPSHLATPHAKAAHIYRNNLEHIDACDAVLANLAFFRGAEPDSGTCFEVGYAIARGKPVIAYVPDEGNLAERIRRHDPALLNAAGEDPQGWHVEQFDLPLNLMLGIPCRVVVGDLRAALAVLQAGGRTAAGR